MPPRKEKENFTDSEREAILEVLLTLTDMNNGKNKLKKGSISNVALKFQCTRQTISRIWSRALASWESGQSPADVRSN